MNAVITEIGLPPQGHAAAARNIGALSFDGGARSRRSSQPPIIPPPLPPVVGAMIVIPELCPRLRLLVAVNVAPPENVISDIAAHDIVGDPEATEIVAEVPWAFDAKPIAAELVPTQVKALVIVVVVEEGNVTVF